MRVRAELTPPRSFPWSTAGSAAAYDVAGGAQPVASSGSAQNISCCRAEARSIEPRSRVLLWLVGDPHAGAARSTYGFGSSPAAVPCPTRCDTLGTRRSRLRSRLEGATHALHTASPAAQGHPDPCALVASCGWLGIHTQPQPAQPLALAALPRLPCVPLDVNSSPQAARTSVRAWKASLTLYLQPHEPPKATLARMLLWPRATGEDPR